MQDFKVGQKVFRLVDRTPIKSQVDGKIGEPWFTFESAKVIAVFPKSVRLRVREPFLNSKYVWTRRLGVGKSITGELYDGFSRSKKQLLQEELYSRQHDLGEAKEEVAYRQQFISRLKRMLKNHS